MFNPQSLRLCCLATMAPALTSEAATRARDKLTGSPASPSIPLMNGQDTQMSVSGTGKGGVGPTPRSHFMATTRMSQVVNISKDLQKKLTESGHLVDYSRSTESHKGTTADFSAITSLSELYKQQQHEVFGVSSAMQSQQQENLVCTSASLGPPSVGRPQPSRNLMITTSQSNGTNISLRSSLSAGVTLAVSGGVASSSCQVPAKSVLDARTLNKGTGGSTSVNQQSSSQLKLNVSNGFNSLMGVGAQPKTSAFVTLSSMGQNQLRSFIAARNSGSVQLTSQLLNSVEKQQKILETRAGQLMRRLRRLQCRQAVSYTKQQLAGFVEQQQQIVPACSRTPTTDLQTELLHSKSMSTAALVELVHKMQSSQPSVRQHSSSSSCAPDQPTRLGEEKCAELDLVSSRLRSSLSHLQSALDSDATESSSGGESCDELDYDDDWDGKVPRPPIQCRAEWCWASDRAAVASRWTWLQAQVSDLEYRIRQQYDIYKQIKANKGGIILGEPPPMDDLLARSKEHTPRKVSPLDEKIANLQTKHDVSPSNVSSVLGNVEKQSDKLKNQMTPFYTPQASPASVMSSASSGSGPSQKTPSTLNGFIDSAAVQVAGENSTCFDDTFQAARCRPVKSYRKRKLLSTVGLHQQNRKAARLSTVSCHCYPPVMPCAMCGGRYNNMLKLDPTIMPLMERVALVDSSFHPVLSFPEDIGLSTHFESMLKTGKWQQKPPPKAYKVLQPDRKRLKLKDGVRRYQRKLKKNTSAAILSSTKIRNKYEQKQLGRSLVNSPVKSAGSCGDKKLMRGDVRLRKQKIFDSIHSLSRVSSSGDLQSADSSSLGGSSQSQMWKELKEGLRRKRGESAYDINNIVIPYSIAASTRVERLQYKEILTPKWREVNGSPDNDESPKVNLPPIAPAVPTLLPEPACEPAEEKSKQSTSVLDSDDSEVEDMSDEVFRQRHQRCEISEKQRFAKALPSKHNRRHRATQRSDGSAVTNTHTEPGSPDHAHMQESVYSGTPPSTPGLSSAVVPDDCDELVRRSLCQDYSRRRSSSVSSAKSNRSRSASHSEERRVGYDEDRPIIAPWTKRSFPLTDDEYEQLIAPPSLKNNCVPLREVARVITEEMAVTVQNLPTSPLCADNSDTSSDIVEDPDDPEWTVVTERHTQQARQPHLVLKLAKR